MKLSEVRHVTIWELREMYGFRIKTNPLDFRGRYWSHNRMRGLSDLEIYKMWIREHGETIASNPETQGG